MTARLPRTSAAVLVTSLLLVACASTPATQFYTLEPLTTSGTTTTVAIRIGHVTIPELVDRPQMVLRAGANQVSLIEQRRWAESLRSAVARVVTANLTTPGRAVAAAITTVDIDVDRFDSQLGVAVDLAAHWRIDPVTGTGRGGSMSWHEPVAGNDYADLAAAHSRALAALSRHIAASVEARP